MSKNGAIRKLKYMLIHIYFFRFLALLEFIIGTKQQSEEMGTSWLTEAMEEMRFALQCYGSSKVRFKYFKKSLQILIHLILLKWLFHGNMKEQ